MQMRGIITEVSRRALGEHGRVDLGHQDIGFALSRGILHTRLLHPHSSFPSAGAVGGEYPDHIRASVLLVKYYEPFAILDSVSLSPLDLHL